MRNRFLGLLLLSLVLSGCSMKVGLVPAPPTMPVQATEPRIVLFPFNADDVSLTFAHDEQDPKRVSEWAASLDGELLVANGVYFHDDSFPSGLFVSSGKRVGDRAFDANKSGLLVLQPTPAVIDTSASSLPDVSDLVEAAQSFPFLIKDGHAAIAEDSGLVARRTFIGNDKDGRIYIGTVAADAISLYDLSQELAAMAIPWDNVMNLDGGPSTGVVTADPNDTDFDSFSAVPNVLVVRSLHPSDK